MEIQKRLRVLGYLLQGGLAHLSASEQAVYLRLLWLVGLEQGSCQCGIDQLSSWTGLGRATVFRALRRLQNTGLVRPYPRRPKRKTSWLVVLPAPHLPDLPPGLREERAPRAWIVDRLEADDLELARGLLNSLGPAEREAIERQAAEELKDEDPEKAVLEIVVRRYFGPGRLQKYLEAVSGSGDREDRL